MKTNKILQGDALAQLKTLPEKSINMVMTSPPYWALRDYGVDVETIWDGDKDCEHDFKIKERQLHSGKVGINGTVQASVDKEGGFKTDWKTKDGFCKKCGAWKGQMGLEPTFDLYIKHLCDIFDEVKRVLRDDGTCWVNLGDSYAGNMGKKNGWTDNKAVKNSIEKGVTLTKKTKIIHQLSQKCLVGIPMRFAIEMINRGWILRNVIIWHKPNCMPSSVKDRFTVDFEYIFFFSKKKKYYFETQYEPLAERSLKDNRLDKGGFEYHGKREGVKGIQNRMCGINSKGRNKRTVWRICPQPFKESHFAVFPEELCETPIKSGCPEFICEKCGNPKKHIIKKEVIHNRENKRSDANVRPDNFQRPPNDWEPREILKDYWKPTCNCNVGFTGGIVLDPFFGAGTTGLVALKQGKKFIGMELNPEYIEIAEKRLKPFLEQKKLK